MSYEMGRVSWCFCDMTQRKNAEEINTYMYRYVWNLRNLVSFTFSTQNTKKNKQKNFWMANFVQKFQELIFFTSGIVITQTLPL